MSRVWVAAAEASGDALGASLVQELRRRHPGLEARGLAGPRMRAAGVFPVADSERATAMGIVGAVRRAPEILGLLPELRRDVARTQPDVLITIDSPGFLLRLARAVDVPTLHWVAPQVWAWRPGRVHRIAESVDTLCCLLPFEPTWFANTPVRAVFTGHPAARIRPVTRSVRPRLVLAPGSRADEVRRLWPVFRNTAAIVRRSVPELQLVVAQAPTVRASALGGLAAEFAHGMEPALEGAWAALVCSGTAALEVAARGVPAVVAYRTHPLTWAIGRGLVRGVEHVCLPNILLGQEVVPEHLQHLEPTAIARDLRVQLERPDQSERVLPALGALAAEGSVARVADEVERLIARRSSRPERSPTG